MSRAHTPRDAELAFLALLLRWADVQNCNNEPLDEEEARSFYRALGNYYKASVVELHKVCGRYGPIDEIAVVLHIARNAGVDVESVLNLRSAGRSWMSILTEFHIVRDALHVPVGSPTTVFPGMPYHHLLADAREAWADPDLNDSDIVNLVNLKFISEYYGWRAEHVIALRSAGRSFAGIHGELAKVRGSRPRRTPH